MAVRSVVIRYVGDVSSLASSLDKVADSNDKVAKKAEGTQQKISGMTKVAGAMGLAIGASIAKFAEFDAQMSAVAASSGATGKELDNLRDAAIRAGADTQYSATEAAAAMTELSKAGVSTSDILGGGLAGSLDLAAAGQMGVAESAETAATAMTQFGLKGSDVSHVADLLAAGAGKAQGSVQDMGMALKQAGLVASQTGLSIEETTGGLTAFASAGLIGSDAGTSFKAMLQRLTPQSKEAQRAMDELGISAYDSQGNFIGLAEFAGNLQTALRDLTPEQRNSAMATIFGSDAVRAASVLYSQGEAGIRKWTDAVNDTGFAQRQAAALTDNLTGDLERLGGALDTALISKGSSLNGMLRGAVQGLEKFVEFAGNLPNSVYAGAAAFVAMSVAGRKLGPALAPLKGMGSGVLQNIRLAGMYASEAQGGFNKMATGARVLGSSMGGLRGITSGVVGILGGPWNIVLMAATGGLMAFMQANANAAAASKQLSDTLDEQTGKFTTQSRETVFKWISDDLQGITAEQVQKLKDAGISLNGMTDAALQGGPAMTAYQKKLADVGMQHKDLMEITNGAQSSIENSNEAVQGATALWGLQSDALKENKAVSEAAAAGQDLLRAAADAVSFDNATSSMMGFNDEQTRTAQEAQESKEALDNLKASILEYGNVAAGAINSEMAWQAAIDDNTAALANNGRTLDLGSEKGRANMATLLQMASAAKQDAVAKAENGASTQELTKKLDAQRVALEKAAVKMGMSKDAAKKFADELIPTNSLVAELTNRLNGTPKDTKAKVSTPGATQGQQQVNDLRAEIAQLRGKTVTVDVVAAGIAAVKSAINSIQNITRTVTVKQQRVGQAILARGGYFPAGSPVVAFAGGGSWSPDTPDGHLPHIAPGGTYRMFAERETQGEAYIPLANDWRRPQAKAILGQVAGAMGGSVEWYASGGLYNAANSGLGPNGAEVRALILQIVQPLKAAADAAKALAEQQRVLRGAQNTWTVASRQSAISQGAVMSSQSAYTRAVQERDALKAKTDAAKKAAAATKGVTAADRQYASLQKQLAAANAKVTAATNAKKAAEERYKAAADRTKEATDALKNAQQDYASAQQDMLSQQKALADQADRVAESFREAYGPKSVDPGKWVKSMMQGAGDINLFLSQIEKLRAGGLNEELVQQIIEAGSLNGGRLADNILSEGSINALNTSWQKLLGVSTEFGMGAISPGLGGQIDYKLLAETLAQTLPIKPLLDTLATLPGGVKKGVSEGMIEAQGAARRYERTNV